MSKLSDRLFVYGIFLSERTQQAWGMTNPQYATVGGYLTIGNGIVQAVQVNSEGVALTGLTVDVDPERWKDIDRLEGGYDRIRVTTQRGEQVWMYAAPERQ